jgi:hypothetical protein
MGEGLVLASLPLQRTDFICADCGDPITYMDEVFQLQVIRPVRPDRSQTLYLEVTDEHHPEDGFLFEPYYFCYRCWEKNYDEIRDDMEDEPPVDDADSKFECVCCGSGIRQWELAGTFALGEFRLSERSPNGERSASFVTLSNVDMLCIYCLTILNDGYIDMWQDLSENHECTDCVQARCWRATECGCRCHHSPPEEDDDEFAFQSFT